MKTFKAYLEEDMVAKNGAEWPRYERQGLAAAAATGTARQQPEGGGNHWEHWRVAATTRRPTPVGL